MTQKYIAIIAEKPNAMKRIAEALAENKSLKKHVTENKTIYYTFERNGKKHVVLCAVGHLFNLDAKQSKWTYPVFDYEWKPSFIVRKASAFSKKYYDTIDSIIDKAKEIVVATDYDTEGELIGYNIVRFMGKNNDAKRMKFSTLTKDELISSYQNMLPHLDFKQLEAGMTRHELDWLWGINLTRALTLSLKNNGGKGFSILSTGRVQGPTLYLLFKREQEIKKFKPKTFWEIQAQLKVDHLTLTANYIKSKIWNKKDVEKVLGGAKAKECIVKNITKRSYNQLPPVPFNTTDLQAEAYAQFKFSPRQTLNIAESLYQAGYISYPRSSSQKLPPSINYKKILNALTKIPKYKKFVQKILSQEEIKPNEGKKEDPAHPAVYPTHEIPDLNKLTSQQKRLYDLIVRRTLATFGKPAKRESMRILVSIGKEEFVLTGKRTLELGWTEIYKPYLAIKEQILPELKIGDKLKVVKVESLEKQTQPPSRYSQGSIIREMEKRGLGTRATRAGILQTLYDRKYIIGKSIQVTILGEGVTKTLEKFSPDVLSEELTRKFEKEMELIYKGKKKRSKVIKEAKKTLKKILNQFKQNEKPIGKKLSKSLMQAREKARILGPCKKCDGVLKIMRGRSGKLFAGCSSYPKCSEGYPLPQHARIEPTGKICPKCGTPIIRVFRKGKRPFTMCLDPNCPTKADWGKKNEDTKKKVLSKGS